MARKWAAGYPGLCLWVEENIEETLSFYRLPRQHHKNLKSTNVLERIMEEIKRRNVSGAHFPNAVGCLRLVVRSLWRCTRTASRASVI